MNQQAQCLAVSKADSLAVGCSGGRSLTLATDMATSSRRQVPKRNSQPTVQRPHGASTHADSDNPEWLSPSATGAGLICPGHRAPLREKVQRRELLGEALQPPVRPEPVLKSLQFPLHEKALRIAIIPVPMLVTVKAKT